MLPESSSVAVIGGGISGITAAYLLQKRYNVTLFESEPQLGGHAHTVTVQDQKLGAIGVDMGFIVLNDRNYPNFTRLLRELEVPTQASEMSFGFADPVNRFSYSGRSLNSLFAERRNLVSPSFYRFLSELLSFNRQALRDLEVGSLSGVSLREYLTRLGVSQKLIQTYVLPMGAAIWSSSEEGVGEYPAEAFLAFFKNHGLLEFTKRPQWRTITGGSRRYIEAFQRRFRGTVRLNARIHSIRRGKESLVRFEGGEESFAAVVLATHAPISLKLLEQPSALEESVLGAWSYTPNSVILHNDHRSHLPQNRRAWASWNYRKSESPSALPAVTYWMNNLQQFSSPTEYCVTLNTSVHQERSLRTKEFEHPFYSFRSIESQKKLKTLQGHANTFFCGAYFGYGFHEDGCRSGKEAAEALGVTW